MAVTAIVPARYASSRFPGKPLALILGKPMIQWVVERLVVCSALDRIAVASDDERILSLVRSLGVEAVPTCSNHASGTDRLAEAANKLALAPSDWVVNVQGDEPEVDATIVESLVRTAWEHPVAPMATLAYATDDMKAYLDPNVVKVVTDQSGKALYFSRAPIPHRREAGPKPIPFLKHLGYYIYRADFLHHFASLPPTPLEMSEKLEQLRALEHGYAIAVGLSPKDTCGIDTPEDLIRLENRWRSHEG
ncbi:3-deoxy-manno-octulosonate cytidylyltransferase [Desulfosoma caldarium]|uniref:3-deoxy-manno-octulosonate cytidylyltransferase n=1 Tax=Desulfosoma caldarium TaxID=610254 RepID=A0A3N1UQY7_9BACT|nr:3-deoxy-manno-octulosonate cytidylyltransferase [Desulfosoma caldarium]ROQ93522.1 3-deoxy-manno-octulosonate cytidylyltransferase (CMP-KDO synthetase) [Desulfosoma caldarium]